MNIWVINQTATPPSYGGLVRHYYFSKYLQQSGHNVKIITASKIHNTDINMIKDNTLYVEKEVDGVEYTFVKTCNYVTNGIKRIYSMLQFANNAIKVCKRLMKSGEFPDIIYASSPSPFSAYTAIKFAKKKKISSVVEVRDLWPKSIVDYNGMSESNLIIKILYQLEKWIYMNADRIIFTMEGGKDYIKDKKWDKDIDLRKVHYVNNGVDLEEFEKDKSENKIDDIDLQDTSFYKVIYTGSIRKANNLDCIVDAAKICKEKSRDNIKFIIYGDGTFKEELIEKCKNYNLNNIIFKGKVGKKNIPYILSCSDLTLLNYMSTNTWKYGSSQNKLFEYLASGHPVLSTIEINYSIIKKYNCGIELKVQNPQTVADSVIKMSEMPADEYAQMCENAKQAASDFDFRLLSKKLLNIFNELKL